MLQAEHISTPQIGPDYKKLVFLTITFLGIGILIWHTTKPKRDDEEKDSII